MNRLVILSRLRERRGFVYIKRKVDADLANEITDHKLAGIFTEAEEKRYYPYKDLGSSVVGFVGTDINIKGLAGVEASCEKYLKSTNGIVKMNRDERGRQISPDTERVKNGNPGADVHLTIDFNIQYTAQKELENTVKKWNAKQGSIIVMNPNTGAILAMASYPSCDPNDLKKLNVDTKQKYLMKDMQEVRKNRTISKVFEPGSTFKIFTMAAFLRKYPNTMTQTVNCHNGEYEYFGRKVHDHEKHGILTVPEVMKYSSNIGMVELALKLGYDELYDEYRKFGFGETSGIDLPGEEIGLLWPIKKWNQITMTSIPYGQEIAVTEIQLARAYAAIANGGYLVQPYVVDKIVKEGNTVYEHKPVRSWKIMSEDVRKKLLFMLKSVVEKGGTATKAAIAGYTVAGKTGTAQKQQEGGRGYMQNGYNASFVGFLPADKPQLLTVVVVDEPRPVYYGGEVAAPIFKVVNSMAVSYLDILPDAPEKIIEVTKVEMVKLPDFKMKKYADVKTFMNPSGLGWKTLGFGKYIIKQEPAAGTNMEKGELVYFYLGDVDKDKNIRTYMPDLKGYPIRKAIAILAVYNVKAKCKGTGVTVAQDPKPGVLIKAGSECSLSFTMQDKI